MVAAAQGDPALVGDRDDVVCVDVVQQEAHQPGAADVRAEKPDALLELGKPGVGVGAELLVVPRDIEPPDLIEVIHRGMQAHGAGNVRGARLELVRGGLPRAPVELHVQDHFPAALIRRHVCEHFLAAVQDPDAGRPAHFVAREGQEVAADLLDIHRAMPGALRGVHQCRDAELARAGAQVCHGVDRAERVGDVGYRQQFHLGGQELVQAGGVEQADVAGHRQANQPGAGVLG